MPVRFFSTCMFSKTYPKIADETSQYNKTIYNHLYKAYQTNEDLNKEFLEISSANAEKTTIDPGDA